MKWARAGKYSKVNTLKMETLSIDTNAQVIEDPSRIRAHPGPT